MHSVVEFSIIGDHDGNLVALEQGREIPFKIKRIYYIWGNQRDIIRGKHAHKELEQIVICLSGSCDFILNDGTNQETIHLDTPSKGLYISNNIWREFTNFSDDCVIMVIASNYYDESDYIRDYNEFLKVSK